MTLQTHTDLETEVLELASKYSKLSYHLQCQCPTKVLVQVLAASLLYQLPVNIPGKEVNRDANVCVPATHVRDLEGILGC